MKFKLVTAQVTAYFSAWLDALTFMNDHPSDGPWELYDEESQTIIIKGGNEHGKDS